MEIVWGNMFNGTGFKFDTINLKKILFESKLNGEIGVVYFTTTDLTFINSLIP
jgi:hypothetical protein